MKEQIKDGGPAFPTITVMNPQAHGGFKVETSPCMSLRDWFAGMALQGLVGSLDRDDIEQWAGKTSHQEVAAMFAKDAYMIADAMLTEREKAT